MSPDDNRTTGVHRIKEYAVSDQGKRHAKLTGGVVGGGATVAAMAVFVPMVIDYLEGQGKRDESAQALQLCHEQLESQQKSYDALVQQVTKRMLERH